MGTLVVLDLMGGVALLLWGLHMVRSGILRAFGPDYADFCQRPSATASPASLPALDLPRYFRAARLPVSWPHRSRPKDYWGSYPRSP